MIDIAPYKVALLNRNQSPIEAAEIEDYLQIRQLNLVATQVMQDAYADYVIIAPSDYDPKTNCLNTQSVEALIQEVLAIKPHPPSLNSSSTHLPQEPAQQLGACTTLAKPTSGVDGLNWCSWKSSGQNSRKTASTYASR